MSTWLGSRDPIRLQDVILANVVVKPPEIWRWCLLRIKVIKDAVIYIKININNHHQHHQGQPIHWIRNQWKIRKTSTMIFMIISWVLWQYGILCFRMWGAQARFFAEASPRRCHPCLEKWSKRFHTVHVRWFVALNLLQSSWQNMTTKFC